MNKTKVFKKSRLWIPVLALSGLVALAGFQNCSNVNLSPVPKTQSSLGEAELKGRIDGRYCTQLGQQASGHLKVIIILDLSLSNVGSYSATGAFQTSLGTDPNSDRFQALKNFITSCSAGAEYAVVGFATSRMSRAGGNCAVPFGTPASASSELDYLYATERANRSAVIANPAVPRLDLLTSYEQGLSCAKDLVVSDLERGPVQPNTYYHVFFVTDGSPTVDSTCQSDANGNLINCDHEAKNTTRVRRITDSAIALGAEARVQPVFYGSLATAPVRSLMSKMAVAGRVNDYILATAVDQVNFCSLLSQPNQVKYTKSSFIAVPLTTRPSANSWVADSDIDGIADEAEPALGFSVGLRRTGGVLDGICRILGGPANCQAFVAARACSMLVNNFGLTGCDLAALGFPAAESVDAGIDSDGDGIPDAVEIMRGTEPGNTDAIHDSDGDGVSNVGEIRRGSLADAPDAGRDPKQFLSITEYRSSDQTGCPEGQEVWGFSVENIPLPDIPAFIDSGVTHPGTQAGQRRELSLAHDRNEHLIFLGFHASAVGRSGAPGQQLGAVVRIQKDGYKGQPVLVNPADFVLLGETPNE